MRSLKSVSRFTRSEEGGYSTYLFLFLGLSFLFAGLRLLLGEGLYFRGEINWTPVFFGGIGVVMLWGGIDGFLFSRKFGKPQAWISELVTRPGDTIHFFFEQPCRQNLVVKSVRVFLVFRERVDFYEVSETVTREVDRLEQQFEYTGRAYSAGDVIRHQCVFRIPDRDMGLRNSHMNEKRAKVETLWVVKVRINLGGNRDVWKEYDVEVTGEPRSYVLDETSATQGTKVDVILVKGPTLSLSFGRHRKIIDSLFPHLNGEGTFAAGHPLLERITPEQAEYVRTQLQAANVQVEIKPSV